MRFQVGMLWDGDLKSLPDISLVNENIENLNLRTVRKRRLVSMALQFSRGSWTNDLYASKILI